MRRRVSAIGLWGLAAAALLAGGGAVQVLEAPDTSGERAAVSGPSPLVWLHVPKTGSSFLNALVHTPSLCPGVPKDFAIDPDHCPPQAVVGCPSRNHIRLDQTCNGSFEWERKLGEHRALGKGFQGRALGFFRQPEARILSHFHYLRTRSTRQEQIDDFVRRFQGCAVKMMTRSGLEMGVHCGGGEPSGEEVQEALRRIDQFVFVGLTERWGLSMCLFRKIFGGHCLGSDFLNTRPSDVSQGSKLFLQRSAFSTEGEFHFKDWSQEELNGFVDKYDGQLYERVVKKFESLLEAHGVSDSSCRPCFDEKERTYVAADLEKERAHAAADPERERAHVRLRTGTRPREGTQWSAAGDSAARAEASSMP